MCVLWKSNRKPPRDLASTAAMSYPLAFSVMKILIIENKYLKI